MIDLHTSEQALRREAIRRQLAGEHRKEICDDLGRSTSWFDIWWAVYRDNPDTDFADCTRAPQLSRHATPEPVRQAAIAVRHTFEAAATPVGTSFSSKCASPMLLG